MRILLVLAVGLFIAGSLGADSYEDEDDYEYVYYDEDEYEYVDDCLDADDDGYCETDEDLDYEPDFGEDDETEIRVDMGNTARITCTVNNLGSSVISWKKDDAFLSLGASALSDDPRMTISMTESSSTLTITLIKAEDAGDYVCQVATKTPITKTFTVVIGGPPNVKIVNKPQNGTYTVQAGTALALKCEGAGDPTPTLSWKRLNSQMPASQNSQNSGDLQFANISENDSGTYQCAAENGYGEPAVDSVQILVKHKPKIYVQEKYVENNETRQVELLELTCTVQAYPRAEATWSRSDSPLPEDRINTKSEDGRHILEIRNPRQSDVGVYTCEASNSEGKMYAVLKGEENKKLPNDQEELALKQQKIEQTQESGNSGSRGQFVGGSVIYGLLCLTFRAQL